MPTKEELEERLARRNSGNGSSRYNPFKADGVNLCTLGQMTGLAIIGFEKGKSQNASAYTSLVKEKRPGLALRRVIKNLDPRESSSGKVLTVATVAALGASLIKRKRAKPLRAGIFKLA